MAQRVALLLDRAGRGPKTGERVPAGWHFALLGCETPRSEMRHDGFPGLGIPVPAISCRRVVAGGRKTSFGEPLRVGEPLRRSSRIMSLTEKRSETARHAILTVEHCVLSAKAQRLAEPAVREEQSYVFLEENFTARPPRPAELAHDYRQIGTFLPDQTHLFQFSAISFNSHKIHLDRSYAQKEEGYPDLVVNGGLTTLLMCELAQHELGLSILGYSVINKAPLFCGRKIAFVARETSQGAHILAIDDGGQIAAEMEIQAHDV